jgi:heptosyltransferase I
VCRNANLTMTTIVYPKISDVSGRNPAAGPRVLLVRLSAIGDCIQTMPLACAVREHWPNAHLTWVVEKGSAALVETCEAVDRVIAVPKGFALTPGILTRLRVALRATGFHFALDPQGLTKSGLVSWQSGARRRIGFARPQSREINSWLQTETVASRTSHRVTQYLELLGPLGVERSRVRFGIKIPLAAESSIARFLHREAPRGGYVVLNPGAGWDSKRWPLERYAEVAQHLSTRGITPIVAWGGEQEKTWAASIVEQAAGAAIMAPNTSLLELAALLKGARFFVGSDTGPMHLAAAVGTPCVALFGSSVASVCGPYGPHHITLQRAFDESPGRKRPGADNWAMREIAAHDVCAACDRLLAGRISAPEAA